MTSVSNEQESSKQIFGLNESIALQINEALDNEQETLARELLLGLHYADIADFIDSTTHEKRQKTVEILGKDFKPEILVELDESIRENVIEILGFKEAGRLINKLSVDDAIVVIEDIDEDLRASLDLYINVTIRKAFLEDLQFPEYSAGRLMHKDIVVVLSKWNVGEILDFIRRDKNLPETFNDIYVTDTSHEPIGLVKIDKLIRSARDAKVTEIMEKEIHLVKAEVDQNEVSFLFKQYDLTSAPVIDSKNRLLGVINLVDIVDIIDDEAEEDLMRMGGVSEQDIHFDYYTTVKQRFPWLFINLLTACATAFVISLFDHTINHTVAAASIMTIVASLGGNAGTQTSTISVRAIATKDISSINSWRVTIKETTINCINGILMSLIGFIVIMFIYKDIQIATIFSVSIILSFTIAGFFGSLMPFLLNRLNIDPALASGIFLSALTDVMGFFIFLALVAVFVA
jgi:magnesium transporter